MSDESSRNRPLWRCLFVVLGILPVSAACEPDFPAQPPRGFQLQEVSRAHVVRFAPSASSPTAEEEARLRDFLRSENLRAARRAVISGGFPLMQQRRKGVAEIVRELGGPEIVFGRAGPPSDVEVILHLEVFYPEACLEKTALRADWLPLGCANEYNLSRQVENPKDLERGRRPAPSPAARAVELYRDYLRNVTPPPPPPAEAE